jgi:hypothetical protein
MTPLRFRECLYLLGWTQANLPKIMRVRQQQVRRWAVGDMPIPANVADWLERLVTCHTQNPPPIVL